MSVTSIMGYNGVPFYNHFYVAYRPVFILAFTTPGDPVCYCDIYLDGSYYKTISSSTYTKFGTAKLFWFDAQEVIQEYLQTKIIDITKVNYNRIYNLPEGVKYGMAQCYLSCRGSSVDAYGIITPEPLVPIQGTVDTLPSPGGGLVTDPFYVVNASLQHEDIQDLESSLLAYKKSIYTTGTVVPGTMRLYPLSHMVQGKAYVYDWGQFPFMIMGNGLNGAASSVCTLKLITVTNAGVQTVTDLGLSEKLYHLTIYSIPIGIQNIVSLYPAAALFFSSISSVQYYRVAIYDTGANKPAFVTPDFYFQQSRGAADKRVRIWFQNYLGQLDAVNFLDSSQSVKTTSGAMEKLLIYAPTPTYKAIGGQSRAGSRSNESTVVTDVFQESELEWLKEMFASSKTFVEYIPNDAEKASPGGLNAELLPIRILDAEYETLRVEDRYEYQVSVKFEMSNENIIVRN